MSRPGDFAFVVQPPPRATGQPLSTEYDGGEFDTSHRSSLAGPSLPREVAHDGLRFEGLLHDLRAEHAEPITAEAFG
jgi:hypothetical protein